VKAILIAICAMTVTAACAQDVRITWDAPATNVDGSACTNLIAYKLYAGTVSGTYTTNWTIDAATNEVAIPIAELPKYYAVSAVNDWGVESALSDELLLESHVPAAPQRVRRIVYEFVNGRIIVTTEP